MYPLQSRDMSGVRRMIYIGIDPGLSGSICILENGIPRFQEITDLTRLLCIMSMQEKSIAIEKQNLRPNQSGMGLMMKNYGRLLGMMEVYGITPTEVLPRTWYKHFGIRAGMAYAERKKFTAGVMEGLYPDQKDLWYGPRGGLIDGRTDALAIASWLKGTST
jgi:hypothetical protein